MPRENHPAARGTFQHIVINATDGQLLFRDDQDKYRFIKDFQKTRESMDVTCISAGLVDTHAHLELASGDNYSCSAFMHRLLTSYCSKFNLRYERRGHVLRNRHYWRLMSDPHALNALRYIILNPLKAGLVHSFERLERYPFTILPELLGHLPPRFAAVDATLRIFGDTAEEAHENLRAWIRGGLEDPKVFRAIENIFRRRHVLLNLVAEPIDIDAEFAEIVARVCAAARVTRDVLVAARARREATCCRAAIIYLATRSLAMRQSECAQRMQLSKSAVSQLIKRGEEAARVLGVLPAELIVPGRLLERLQGRTLRVLADRPECPL